MFTTLPDRVLTAWRALNGRRTWQIFIRTLRIFQQIDGEQRAASFAYYAVFSMIPLFALLLTVGSAFFETSEITKAVEKVLPITDPHQQKLIWHAVANLEHARGGVGLVSVCILLWCSLRFFQALVRGVNRAWHTVEIPWWQMPLRNLLMVAILGASFLVGLLTPALLQGLRNLLFFANAFVHSVFPDLNLHLASVILDWSRYGLGGVVLFASFSLFYKVAPRRKVLFRQVLLPALLVTVMLLACQVAFVNYLPRFVNYNAIYGPIGGIMLLLLWVYLSGTIIILGGCLCAALDQLASANPLTPSTSEN